MILMKQSVLFCLFLSRVATAVVHEESWLWHELADVRDRILIMENRLKMEEVALSKAQVFLHHLEKLGPGAAPARALKQARFDAMNHANLIEEYRQSARVGHAEEAVWSLRWQYRKQGVDPVELNKAYRLIWQERSTLYYRMSVTSKARYDYEVEYYQDLKRAQTKGSISVKQLIEAEARAKEALLQWQLATRRRKSIEQFLK